MFLLVRFPPQPVALGILTGVRVDLSLAGGEMIARSERDIFGGVDERLVGARRQHQQHGRAGDDQGRAQRNAKARRAASRIANSSG